MSYLVTLLAAILVSLLCSFGVNAQIDRGSGLDNNIQPINVVAPRRRIPRNYVHIQEAPPGSVRLLPGTPVVLTCDVIGKPAPIVQWTKNGEPLADFEEENNFLIPSHPSSAGQLLSKMVISTATSGDVYTCVATSDLYTDSASTTVYVDDESEEENLLTLQKLLRQPSKPIITSTYVSIFQNMFTDLVLPCRVQSNSKAEVMWEHNLNLVYGNPRMRVLPSGDLLVTNLKWSDMGNFTCIANNAYGQDVATTFAYPINVVKA